MTMKRMCKLLSSLLAVVFALGMSGCGGKLKGVKGTLNIASFEGGYGSTWATALKDAYIAHNPEAKVVVTCNPLVRETAVTALQTNMTDVDLFFIDGVGVGTYCENYGSLADISELYSLSPKAGENEENTTVKDKIMPEVVSEMTYGGDWKEFENKYYTVPSPSGPCSLILNADALDNALGKGNWREPRTTDELFALCDAITAAQAKVTVSGVKHTVYPFIYSGEAVEYWRYLYYPWIAQYGGLEVWNNMQNVKTNGQYAQEAYRPEAKLKAFEVLERIIKRSNGYCDSSSMNNSFNQTQKYFLQGRACMYVTGDWFEMEAENSSDYKANIKMIRTPVISELASVIESESGVSLTDEKLCEIIGALDDGAEQLDGVSDEVFEKVRVARSYTFTLANSSVGFVPEVSVNKDMAIDFLRFMYSDEGIKIVLRESRSYLPVVNASQINAEGELSLFRKSVNEIMQGDTKYIYSSARDPIHYRAGLDTYVGNEKPEVAMGKKTGALSAREYFEKEGRLLSEKWSDYMKVVG